jgi:GNAT superfamily N-acetyltransferase
MTEGDPDFDPELNIAVHTGESIAGFASAAVRKNGAGGIKFFFIRKQYRRQGLGTALIEELIRRLRRKGADEIAAGEISPNYITPGIDPRYTEAVCFLEKTGFSNTGTGVNMTVDLRNRNWQSMVDNLVSRASVPLEIESPDRTTWKDIAQEISRMGFSDRWIYQAELSLQQEPPGCFVARTGGRICGFACYGALKPGLFGPMGTAPDMRGRGIGRILLTASLAGMQRNDMTVCEINSVGPVAFYSKAAGAVISRIFWKYIKRSS